MLTLTISRRKLIEDMVRSYFSAPVAEALDIDALALAFEDLTGVPDIVAVAEERLSLLAEWSLDMAGDGAAALVSELMASPIVVGAIADFAKTFFRPQMSGASGGDGARRASCRDVVRRFLEAIEEPCLRRLEQIQHASEERERYHRRRRPCASDLRDGASLERIDPRLDAAASAQARECADRVVRGLRGRLRPDVLAALSVQLLQSQGLTLRDVGERFGVSAATLSRARSELGATVSAEAEGLAAAEKVAVVRAVTELMGRPAVERDTRWSTS